MKLNIDKIKINEGRRELSEFGIDKLAESIAVVGMLNPISIDESYTLIAGYHRLMAAKKLGWTEIECNICKLEGLQAELAEIDENLVRTVLTTTERNDLLLHRKEIYETLHPETRAGVAQAAGMNRALGNNVGAKLTPTSKPFVQDAAEKLGVSLSTIKRQVRAAKNTTPEAKEIIKDAGVNLSNRDALKLSKLKPEEQKETASKFASGEIKTVEEFLVEATGATTTPEQINEIAGKPQNAAGTYSCKDLSREEKIENLLSHYIKYVDEVLDRLHSFSVAWDVFTEMRADQIEQVYQTTDNLHEAFEKFTDKIKRGEFYHE